MIHDWWVAHRFELIVDGALFAVCLVVGLGILIFQKRKRG